VTDQWRAALGVSTGILVVLLLYCAAWFGEMTVSVLLSAVAATGGFMLGISFGISSAVRYLHAPGTLFVYRREIGLIGYLYSLVYTFAILGRSPEQYFTDFPQKMLDLPTMLGIFAMTILTMMFLVSNRFASSRLGFDRRKRILRLGYAAYVALVVRAMVIEGDTWLAWLADPAGLPPPRFVLSIFAAVVIVAGLSQHVSKPDMTRATAHK